MVLSYRVGPLEGGWGVYDGQKVLRRFTCVRMAEDAAWGLTRARVRSFERAPSQIGCPLGLNTAALHAL